MDAEVRARIMIAVFTRIGTPYRRESYNCLTFVREVYNEAGYCPVFWIGNVPPWFCYWTGDAEMRTGQPIFLYRKRKKEPLWDWSHIGIVMPHGYVAHCTYYFGKRVTLTQLTDLLPVYDIL